MKNIKWATIIGLLFFIQSCLFDKERPVTIVKGDFSNKITGEKIANIPLEIVKCTGGLLTTRQCDSLTTIYTDTKGEFETSIENEKGFYYLINISKNDFYEWYNTNNGYLIKGDEINIINLSSPPFKVLQVDLKTTKESKNFINIDLRSSDRDYGFGFSVLVDTARSNQIINKRLYFKILPKRRYIISKILCDRHLLRPGEYTSKNCETKFYPEFFADYVDTTKIILN